MGWSLMSLRDVLIIVLVVFVALVLLEFVGWIDVFDNVGKVD